jgi:hypothetical protein
MKVWLPELVGSKVQRGKGSRSALPEISEAAQDDQPISIDLERRTVALGDVVTPLRGLHPFIVEAGAAGGFVEWARAHPPG